jgi:hypothetical protein
MSGNLLNLELGLGLLLLLTLGLLSGLWVQLFHLRDLEHQVQIFELAVLRVGI